MRTFRRFSHSGAHYRIAARSYDIVTDTIITQRALLESHIARNIEFLTSLEPIEISPQSTPLALVMAGAASLCGVGPMAAVAGAIAEAAVDASVMAGDTDVIVENGGDIFMHADKPVTIALFAGLSKRWNSLAIRIAPQQTPVAVCSSSGIMGHSLSFGRCDLATVFSHSGALADAAATRAGNLVTVPDDIESAISTILQIKGVLGIMIICGEKMGIGGEIPELVLHDDNRLVDKISRDEGSDLSMQLDRCE